MTRTLKLWLLSLALLLVAIGAFGFTPSFLASVEQRNITAPAADSPVIPETNRIDWGQFSGVHGGPRHRATVYTNLAAGSTTAAIQAAVNAAAGTSEATAKRVVLLNGHHTNTARLDMPSWVSLEGESTNAVLVLQAPIYAGNALSDARAHNAILSGATRGSTVIVFSNTPTDLAVSNWFIITDTNDANFVHPWGYEQVARTAQGTYNVNQPDPPGGQWHNRGQLVEVTNISGTTVGFRPPLHSAFPLGPKGEYSEGLNVDNIEKWIGIGNMTISNRDAGALAGIVFAGAVNCWVTNVNWTQDANGTAAIRVQSGGGFHTFKRVDITSVVAQSDGIFLWVNAGATRTEDCFFKDVYRAYFIAGRGGAHSWVDCYVTDTRDSLTPSTGTFAALWNHGTGSQFNLIENTKLGKGHIDSIHGGTSDWVFNRVLFRGINTNRGNTYGTFALAIDTWQSWVSITGCGFGHATNAEPTGWEWDRALGASVTNSGSLRQHLVWNFSGYTGTDDAEHDSGRTAKARAKVTGNINVISNQVIWDALGSVTLPSSYIHSNKPATQGNLAWPAVGPDTTGYISNRLAAECRLYGIPIP